MCGVRQRRAKKNRVRGEERGHLVYDGDAVRETGGALERAASLGGLQLPDHLMGNLVADIKRGRTLRRKTSRITNAVGTQDYALALYCARTRQAQAVQTTLTESEYRVDVRLFDGPREEEARRFVELAAEIPVRPSARTGNGSVVRIEWEAVLKLSPGHRVRVGSSAPQLEAHQLTFSRVPRRKLPALYALLNKVFLERTDLARIRDVHDMDS